MGTKEFLGWLQFPLLRANDGRSPWHHQEEVSRETEDALSGTRFREGMILFLPHRWHRAGLVLSLFLCPGTWAT